MGCVTTKRTVTINRRQSKVIDKVKSKASDENKSESKEQQLSDLYHNSKMSHEKNLENLASVINLDSFVYNDNSVEIESDSKKSEKLSFNATLKSSSGFSGCKRDTMRMTLKGIYESNRGNNMNYINNPYNPNNATPSTIARALTFARSESLNPNKLLNRHFTFFRTSTHSSKIPEENLTANQKEFLTRDNSDNNESIFSTHSLLSENENLKNLLDEEDEDGILCTEATNLNTLENLTASEFPTVNKFQSASSVFFSPSNLDESFHTYTPVVKTKLVNFLPICYDVFDSQFSANLSKKIFLINLKKSFQAIAKFLKASRNWEKSTSFVAGSINKQLYLNNYDLLNNHTYELITVIPEDQKDFMLPLYQLVSNNLEVKVSKMKKLTDENIINDKYQILNLISKDEVNYKWELKKCKCLINNEFYSVKIIDKKNNRGILVNEYNMLNRMVFCNYSLQIKEIITSNDYDYMITEYVDCSLYDYIISEHDTNHPELIWKLFRNLLSAVDYCHNVAKISHRNLNLKNVLFIRENYTLKICDFFLASYLIIDNELALLPKSVMCAFPPPEYFEEEINSQSWDIWACGVILFFMLYKTLPVQQGKVPLTFELSDTLISPKYEKNVELNEILYKTLCSDPRYRITLKKLKEDKFITCNKEFPLPNVCMTTLENIDFMTQI